MPESLLLHTGTIRRYLPAVLRKNCNGWNIEYYAYNQITQSLERKRIRVNKERKRARTFAEFRAITSQMIVQINCQLAGGWSPYSIASTLPAMPYPVPAADSKPVSDAHVTGTNAHVTGTNAQETEEDNSIPMPLMLQRYIAAKKHDLTENTMRSYQSFCNNLKKWVLAKYPDLRSNRFTQRMAAEYMDHVLEGHNSNKNGKARKHEDGTVSNRTYNNNLKQGRALFSWAMEKCYCDTNPFEKIKTKREETKTRVLIPEAWRRKIREYFGKNNPQFLIICELVHTSLIRPVEISRLQAYMVNQEDGCIELPANITKNHKARNARLSDELKEMLANHLSGAAPDDYLFADKCWRCGKKPMSSHTYGNVWEAMRKDIGLPAEMQLYSLRDTGINGMLKAGVDPLSVMQAADHSDLSMTTRYANHIDPELFKRLNEKAPEF